MNAHDTWESFREFWREFFKVKTGIVGLVVLLGFIALAVFGPSLVPFPGATNHWRDISFWQDNPQAAPPEWVNALPWARKKGVVSSFLGNPKITESTGNGATVRTFTFTYDFRSDEPPRDIVVQFDGVGQIPVAMSVTRPDGLTADLYSEQLEVTAGALQRISITRNCAQSVIEFIRGQNADIASTLNASLIKPTTLLFAKIGPTMADAPVILKGTYTIVMNTMLLSSDAKVNHPGAIISGHVSGIMGTDLNKRDIFTGIVIGARWALIIGVLTSIITVFLGVVLGVVAAYFGGFLDWILNRLYEFVYLLPVLPFLIVISAIFKPSIWVLILIICLFFWVGPYKPVYSMALQIREETYVEASRALGARRLWIIFRHIVPILLPYSFAVMALSVPGVIVYEASVSLLGLGDATKVTWGQILHDAFGQGAVISNLWWWVVPPGLTIALLGMSFAFLGTALDKILHPKLKTR
jgi:peptide/nickel transport system permease protein